MKIFLIIFSLVFVSFNSNAESNIRPSKSEKIGNIEIWGDYTRNNMFEKGDVFWTWKVAIIPLNTSQGELLKIAKQLFRAYPNTRIRIFDDKSKVRQVIERDIFLNDKSGLAKEVEFPADWVRKHQIANINERSNLASNRWQLVDRFGKHIAFLE